MDKIKKYLWAILNPPLILFGICLYFLSLSPNITDGHAVWHYSYLVCSFVFGMLWMIWLLQSLMPNKMKKCGITILRKEIDNG